MDDKTKAANLVANLRNRLEHCEDGTPVTVTPSECELLLAHIDGEPKRLAAKAEEVREACAQKLEAFVFLNERLTQAEVAQMQACANIVRQTPLTATPLSDELKSVGLELEAARALYSDACRRSDELLESLRKAEARVKELEADTKRLVRSEFRLENSARNWREGAERVEKERVFWRTRAHELEAKLRETQDELAHEKGGRLDEAAIRSAVEKETGMWPYGRIADAVAECLRSQQAKWEARVAELGAQWADENRAAGGFLRRAERAEARVAELEKALADAVAIAREFDARQQKAEARVAELEAQAETDDARAVEVNDAHLKQVATLRARIAELEAYSKLADLDAESEERRADALEVELARGMEACRAHVCLGAQEARAERDEAVAALRLLLSWVAAPPSGGALAWVAARAVLAKYPEGR